MASSMLPLGSLVTPVCGESAMWAAEVRTIIISAGFNQHVIS
jgi:hypothetical protein